MVWLLISGLKSGNKINIISLAPLSYLTLGRQPPIRLSGSIRARYKRIKNIGFDPKGQTYGPEPQMDANQGLEWFQVSYIIPRALYWQQAWWVRGKGKANKNQLEKLKVQRFQHRVYPPLPSHELWCTNAHHPWKKMEQCTCWKCLVVSPVWTLSAHLLHLFYFEPCALWNLNQQWNCTECHTSSNEFLWQSNGLFIMLGIAWHLVQKCMQCFK